MSTPTPPTIGIAADPIDILQRCQAALFAILPPDSKVSKEDAINALLGILDSPEARLVLARHHHAVALADFTHTAARLRAQVKDKDAVWEQAENAAATIHRLRDELDRKRQHETHLIKARDELIEKLCAAEKKLEAVHLALR
jgi:hypothetical protein